MAKRKTKAVPVAILVEIDTWEPTFLGSFQKPNPKRVWSTSTDHVVSISGPILEPTDGAPAPRALIWFFPVARGSLADPELESIGHAYFSGARDDTIDIHVCVECDCMSASSATACLKSSRDADLERIDLGG